MSETVRLPQWRFRELFGARKIDRIEVQTVVHDGNQKIVDGPKLICLIFDGPTEMQGCWPEHHPIFHEFRGAFAETLIGQYLVRDKHGDFSIRRADVFEANYVPLEGDQP